MMKNGDGHVLCVHRGPPRHEYLLHPGWNPHPLRHYSHRLILQIEGKAHAPTLKLLPLGSRAILTNN